MQRRLTQYRVPFFEALRLNLAASGIELVLVHGQPAPAERGTNDGGRIDWALPAPCRYLLSERLCWQDLGPVARGADLLIVPHENRLLYNVLALTVARPRRLAFWGHGRNFQSQAPNGWRERFKRWTGRRADWWFAYTSLSSEWLRHTGVDPVRITNVENAIDSVPLVQACASVTAHELAALRAELALGDGPLGLFLGSLHEGKREGFLLQAGAELARRVPGFRLLVVGDGPNRASVQAQAAQLPWVRVLGARFGRDKAVCLRAAAIVMSPGMVGLNILDAFAAGRPLVTTDCGLHSPEIAYLRPGQNGCLTANTLPAFVEACERLLLDPLLCARLGAQAQQDAERLTLDNMVSRFSAGVRAALAEPAR